MKRIQTYRDIKSSLDVARRQKVSSITSSIEETLKAELETDYGSILTAEERSDILRQEKERKEKQDSALRKSRMNILKVKAKAQESQRVRDELREGKVSCDPSTEVGSGKNLKSENTDKKSSKTEFKKINIRY